MFIVSSERGFLPIQDPLERLPEEFADLEAILNDMPMHKKDGTKGLLGNGALGERVKTMPLYGVDDINDTALIHALFRDYTFLASAYLLEPCHLQYMKSGSYGKGRQVVPANISVPLCKIATKLGTSPFMEYAQSYALYNWQRKDKSLGFTLDNLELIRTFEGGESETGFVIVHVLMVSHTGTLVTGVKGALQEAEAGRVPSLAGITDALIAINGEMAKMWRASKPEDYQGFRTFIMGIRDQPMFPDGVIYDQCYGNEPQHFRGESGANDSIIPTMDNLLQIHMPDNPLSNILEDFRRYRPKEHRDWLLEVKDRAERVGFLQYCLDKGLRDEILTVLKQIIEFRQRHWNFVKEYILKYSKHPKATGGSPIATWLSNQLTAVICLALSIDSSDAVLKDQLTVLESEVEAWRQKFNQ